MDEFVQRAVFVQRGLSFFIQTGLCLYREDCVCTEMGVFVHMAVSEQPIKLDARYLSCMQNYQ